MSRISPPGSVLTLLIVSAVAACSSSRSTPPAPRPPSPAEAHYRGALAALDRSDFDAAWGDLAWLVSRCEAGEEGRRALLLFASAELDTRNPRRSPARAARLAGVYLQLPGASPDEVPLARTLYLMAVDLRASTESSGSTEVGGGSSDRNLPPLAPRFDRCGEPVTTTVTEALPIHPDPTTARRFAELEERLQARTDSLTRARALLADREKKIRDLQSEIERIRKLLKGGGGGPGTSTP